MISGCCILLLIQHTTTYYYYQHYAARNIHCNLEISKETSGDQVKETWSLDGEVQTSAKMGKKVELSKFEMQQEDGA
jgi:hypothetical protein